MMGKEGLNIRIAGVVKESIVDGPGLRFVVFCQGCPHHCVGCHNEETHDFDGGYDCEVDKIVAAVDENPLLSGVTFSGGEPACQPEGFLTLAKALKKRKLDIMMYSGYTFDVLLDMAKTDSNLYQLLDYVDILMDGKYEVSQRDLTLRFRGSKNQNPIDMAKSRKAGKPILAENY